MRLEIRDWLLEQMKARDSLDAVAVTVKLAVTEFGPRQVAGELRSMAARLETAGNLPGWKFPHKLSEAGKPDRKRSVA
ncbi:MAG: hypothetical protein ACR2IF_12065 [Terriglobales bacterium]